MGILIELVPSFGLGFALHFEAAIFELCIGPVIILFGDVDALDNLDESKKEER